MSSLITIDLSPASLESEVAKVLKDLLKDRGLSVRHNGTTTSTAPGGKSDIDLFNDDVHITVETTKLIRVSQSNAEATSVTAHLDSAAAANPGKKTFSIFISPRTFKRTSDHFRLYNKANEALDDKKAVSLSFNTFNIFCDWLKTQPPEKFRVVDLLKLLRRIADLEDDDEVLAHLNKQYFKLPEIDEEVRRLQEQKLREKYSRLDSIFKDIHDDLRSVCGLGPAEAFHELSKLVFLKMFEEQEVLKASNAGKVVENRFTTRYIATERQRRRAKTAKHPIIELFDEVRDEFTSAGEQLFDRNESIAIHPERDTDSYIDTIVARIEDFSFIDPDLPLADIKGMIYEQFLGLSLKNTDLGQYFTPEPIIEFLVKLAELTPDDKVLDPACGTGRFLVHAMNVMLPQATTTAKKNSIRSKQLRGIEKSPYVSKISKMNMFVHGDGRANIREGDSLEFTPRKKADKATVVLTNPPLGDINIGKLFGDYKNAAEWYDSMDVVDKKKTTVKKTGAVKTSVTRKEFKGGALFINKFGQFVDEGGRVLTVIDEAILNTDENVRVRNYIRDNFFIRAVISLTDDAFKYASKTATKTSLLVLEKKAKGAKQTEPIFFAHAFQVGINPKGKPCPNDLIDPRRSDDILRTYWRFRAAVQANTEANGGIFNPNTFTFEPGTLENIGKQTFSQYSYFSMRFDQLGDRLDYKTYDPTYTPIEDELHKLNTVPLSEIVDPDRTSYGLTATGLETGDIAFINIENLRPDGSIDARGIRYIERSHPDLREKHYTRRNDILISRSRLPGIAAVVPDELENEVYGSYIIRFHLREDIEAEFLPEYVALAINSIFGQVQVHRLKSGSNGFNINTGQLGALRIRRIPIEEQKVLIENIRKQRQASARLGALMRKFQDVADLSFIRSAMGEEGDQGFDEVLDGLDDQLKPVETFLEDMKDEEGVSNLEEARKFFEIRPTFYTKIAGAP